MSRYHLGSATLTFSTEYLLERLAALTKGARVGRWLIAFSGGIDSTVLLHALYCAREEHGTDVAAVHVDHGLHEDSAAWAEHCREVAEELGAVFVGTRIEVADAGGAGPEAAAREARYAYLESLLAEDDCLLTAHHEDDQAETLLLNLMRGAGPAGLAGIGAVRRLGRGLLLRPLLGVTGDAIEEYARRHELRWIDDPSNTDTRFDRNFLRREIMPALAARWPAVARRLRQSADIAGEASELLIDLAELDLARLGGPARLDLEALAQLSPARQRNVIRQAVYRLGLPSPPATRLYQAVDELIPAREDAQPLVRWPGAELRRYRGHIYVLTEFTEPPAEPAAALHPESQLDLGGSMGKLSLAPDISGGISAEIAAAGLAVRYRQGGEEIRPVGRKCSHKLKKLLQEKGVVPWMRERLPLLYSGDDLVAVADLWIASECSRDKGFGVDWRDHAPLS